MKIFVASHVGASDGDFFSTIEGELVRLPVVCSEDNCTCQQAMTGLASGAVTTTFTVRDIEIEADMYHELLWSTLERDGWVNPERTEDIEWVELLCQVHIDLAATFDPGERLCLDGDTVSVRTG